VDFKNLLKELYNIKFSQGIKETMKDKRVLGWLFGGMFVYGSPAFYRYVTKNIIIPYMPLIQSPSEYIPSNLIEKLIVNFIAPGGTGAVVGETFIEKSKGINLSGTKKYLARVFGSVATTSVWAGIQYLGNTICDIVKYEWPSGGNPFEPPNFYPFNILLALTLAPLSPYLGDLLSPYIVKYLLKPCKKAFKEISTRVSER
jgi:hypothetical protein